MEQLPQMKAATFFCFGLLGLAVGLRAADFCSLAVSVIDPSGQEVEAPVTVEERDGTTQRSENKPGGVRFCNLGINPVTVTVGGSNCNQVIVRDAALQWGATSKVSVIYDRKACLVDNPPV